MDDYDLAEYRDTTACCGCGAVIYLDDEALCSACLAGEVPDDL